MSMIMRKIKFLIKKVLFHYDSKQAQALYTYDTDDVRNIFINNLEAAFHWLRNR